MQRIMVLNCFGVVVSLVLKVGTARWGPGFPRRAPGLQKEGECSMRRAFRRFFEHILNIRKPNLKMKLLALHEIEYSHGTVHLISGMTTPWE